MIRNQKQMFIVIGAFVLTLLLGTTTYAFFNYTRTGTANIIKTGRIYFNSEQGTSINLDNLFPIDPTETGIMNDATKVGTVTINVTGDTTYTGGIEYLVSAVNVENSVGNKQLPISIDVSYSANGNGKVIGTEDEEYFDNRGGNSSIYKVLTGDTISNNSKLVVGYIAKGESGIDGNIVIKAYIDKEKVAISDTYPEETIREVVENYSTSACETALTGVQDASTICASAEALEGALGSLTNEQLTALVTAGVLREYTNGTPASFGEGRTVLTTTEWNSLQTNGVSFQVKVEANEGIWVDEPVPTIPSCPNCTYLFPTENYLYTIWNNQNQSPTIINDSSDNYKKVIQESGENYFIGVLLNGNKEITNAYACGLKNDVPFCIEGTVDGSKYSENKTILQSSNLWNNTCIEEKYDEGTANEYMELICDSTNVSSLRAGNDSTGVASTNEFGSHWCNVWNSGKIFCINDY